MKLLRPNYAVGDMRKLLFLITIALLFTNYSWAKHEKGGWIKYQYVKPGTVANTSVYNITVTIFYSCVVTGPKGIKVGIYDASSLNTISLTSLNSEDTEVNVSKTTFNPCISNSPSICYLVDTYNETVTLPNTSNGYVIGVTTSGYRVDGLINIENSSTSGLALSAQIPGTINGVDYHTNSSPTFLFKDTALICYASPFTYQFAAIDVIDHDSLSYSFGTALDGSKVTIPPFASVDYASGYSSVTPLGSSITINPATGLISGVAPNTVGEYVIDVMVKEWRNGVMIDSIKKELQIVVYDCSIQNANLPTKYVNCNNFTLSFQNESTAPNIISYLWNFGDSLSTSNTSNEPFATHTYSDTGDYKLVLYIQTSSGCNNSTTSDVKVYPGFIPSFTVDGSCHSKPFVFTDNTYAKYGVINSWNWNYGFNDTANTPKVTHLFSQADTIAVVLNVTSSVGCFGSDTAIVVITDTCTNLPVTLSSFTATAQNNIILTNWQTATELNTSHFIIQHSTDASSYKDLGIVKAIGTGANRYSFTDNNPSNGINYYRLESVDKDGAMSYSKVVSAEIVDSRYEILVYPNPAKDNVTIRGSHIVSVQVIDNMGRVVKVVTLKDATNPVLSVSGLAAGVCHLRIQTMDRNVSNAALMVNGK